jgi:hypothetical protein
MPVMPTASAPAATTDNNIIIGVISAPPDPKGLVADQPIGLNILLNAPGVDDRYAADPYHFGHQIPAGGRMEVELGGAFLRNGVDNDAEFVPINSNFNLILLAGNPQNALTEIAGDAVDHANYTISDDGDKLLTITPNGGSGSNGLEGTRANEIGIKAIHILATRGSNTGPSPFTNGPAGSEGTTAVRIYDAEDELIESGEASITFRTSVGPQVGAVNFGLVTAPPFNAETISTELVEATNFQRVGPGTRLVNTTRGDSFSTGAPYAPSFYSWQPSRTNRTPINPMSGSPTLVW